jgi:ankyrin repeat protein
MGVLELLLSRSPGMKDPEGRTLLHIAYSGGQVKVFEKYVGLGLSLQARDRQGCSSLHHATLAGSVDVTNLLLQEGLEVNAEDVDGWTPLHWATRHGDLAVIQALLAARARADHDSQAGWTPTALALVFINILMRPRCWMFDWPTRKAVCQRQVTD